MQYPAIAQPQYAFAPTFASGGLADAARAVQARGRNEDTMLVHMTPNEVNSLQGLAMAHGGTLTINPDTGLPEASFLKSILPMVAGFALGPAGFGLMTSLQAGLAVGGLTALATGDLGRGLSAGLGAYGGSSLGSALSSTGTEAAKLAALPDAGASAVPASMGGTGASTGSIMGDTLGFSAAPAGSAMAPAAPGFSVSNLYTPAQTAAMQASAPTGFGSVGAGAQDLFTSGGMGRFGSAFVDAAGGPMGTTAAVTGLAQPVMSAFEPKPYDFSTIPREEINYAGPYLPSEREARFPTYRDPRDSSEFSYFSPSNPYPGFRAAAAGGMMSGNQAGGLAALNSYSQGGLSLDDGAFIVDARSVSELGNGSSSAGQERLAQLGGKPIKGPGDGVSDSIPATIGGDTPARVARDEVLFDKEAVRRMGGGSVNKGANKLYAMMENVHDKRKKAKRGQDTKAHKHMPT